MSKLHGRYVYAFSWIQVAGAVERAWKVDVIDLEQHDTLSHALVVCNASSYKVMLTLCTVQRSGYVNLAVICRVVCSKMYELAIVAH